MQPTYFFIFDADCGMCNKTVRWFQKRQTHFQFQTCQENSQAFKSANLNIEDCLTAAYVIRMCDKNPIKIYRGASAINCALRHLPGWRHIGWRILGAFYLLPFIKHLENLGYAWVARNRHVINRSSQACSVH